MCVGSSCHIKGSHKIINRLEELIEQSNLKDKVVLKASFCMGNCTQRVCATLNGGNVYHLNMDNVDQFFLDTVAEEATE